MKPKKNLRYQLYQINVTQYETRKENINIIEAESVSIDAGVAIFYREGRIVEAIQLRNGWGFREI